MAQCASHVVAVAGPATGGERLEQATIEIAWGAQIGVLDHRVLIANLIYVFATAYFDDTKIPIGCGVPAARSSVTPIGAVDDACMSERQGEPPTGATLGSSNKSRVPA
jgi:hypothetical protein